VTDRLFEPKFNGVATISGDGLYRYWLARNWSNDLPTLGWIMLNPSTADAELDDLTLTKCIGFARQHGYGRVLLANLYAYRSTDPRQLANVADPIGPENLMYLERLCEQSAEVVVAWGNATSVRALPVWAEAVTNALASMERHRKRPLCLGTTMNGAPRHPSRLAYETPFQAWDVPAQWDAPLEAYRSKRERGGR